MAQRRGLDPRHLRRARWLRKLGAVRRARASLRQHLAYVLLDPEPDNFTYELANEDELADWVSAVASIDRDRAEVLLAEPRRDPELEGRLRAATAAHPLWSKRRPPFGKRLGWYALARELAPTLIVETGVHDGLGTLLLLRALERNAAEGGPTEGRLISFDVNPAAGWLVGAGHPRWELRVEPALGALPALLAHSPPLGLFIHDSLHTYANEHGELTAAAAHLNPAGVLLSDNAHATSALRDVCAEHGLTYHEFRERPAGHFYPGGALGAGRRATSISV